MVADQPLFDCHMVLCRTRSHDTSRLFHSQQWSANFIPWLKLSHRPFSVSASSFCTRCIATGKTQELKEL